MSIRNALLAVVASLCLNFSHSALADTLALNPDHPDRYVVVKGDTLWDISSKFLRDPWRWPEIWHINPDIKNPHLIYPGDIITLIYVDGKPRLQVKRAGRPTVKLSPKAHATHITSEVGAIPSTAVSQFLDQPRILSEEEIKNAGYITQTEGTHLISGAGSKVYVMNLQQDTSRNYSVFRVNRTYHHPDNKKDILGHEVIHVSDGQLFREGNPATLKIVESYQETLHGDIVMPMDEAAVDQSFVPHAPERKVRGEVLSFVEGLSRAGQYQTLVVNLGKENGIENGHILQVMQAGKVVRDNFTDRWFAPKVQLPDERAGLVMVVRTFEKVSYALIMTTTKDIRIGDPITNP